MTPNKQLSPVIRISQGERDASARATHLEAAFEKYSKTTIERKQMSTTTNFKRIALVAVAALGLGVLTSVPSNAAINADTVTLSSATAAQNTAETYTATSAVVTVTFFGVGGVTGGDSMSITTALTSAPAGNTALPTLQLVETSSAFVDSAAASTAKKLGDTISANTATKVEARASTVNTTAKFAVYLTQGNGVTAPTTAGTYTVKITPATVGGSGAINATAATLTITVTAAPLLDKAPSATTSKVYIQGPVDPAGKTAADADSVVAFAKSPNANGTAGQAAYIVVNQLNAAGGAASDSLTAEISGPGTLGSGAWNEASRGRSLTVRVNDSITVWSDGNSGNSTVTIKAATSGVVLATKTLKFYGATSALTGTAVTAIIGTTGTVKVVAADATAVTMPTLLPSEAIYAFSSDTTIATVPATDLASGYATDSAVVTVTGVKAGSATITFGNKSTLATSTVKSAPVTVRVGSTAIASVTLAFDKATYAPGEKAVITLTTLDSTNLPTVPAAVTLFAAASGLDSDKPFLVGLTDTVTVTSITTASATSATAGTVAGTKKYTVFMPTTPGAVKVSATLASASPLATAIHDSVISATATVTDSGSAALAAVTALATTVASLRTLIVTLTNLVLKIQKKVKA